VFDVRVDVGEDLAGWYSLVSPLITGTRECAAKRSMIACSNVRIITTSTIREITRATSSIGSPRDRCVSVRFKLIAMPPSWFIPASNDTRVRVDAFSNTIASVRSRSGW
jgi:hypothetical protein